MRTIVALVATVLSAAFSMPAFAAAPSREHSVARILRDGSQVSKASDVILTLTGGTVVHGISQGASVADGTRIDVPARVSVVLVSSGAKSTTTIGPNSSFTPVTTGQGELSRVNSGNVVFDVVHGALDFFQVFHTQRFVAAVKGTAFSVNASSSSLKFACTRGTVTIKKTGSILVGATKKDVSLVDVISAASQSQVSYDVAADGVFAKFRSYGDALEAYQKILEQARQGGDRIRIAAALTSVGNLQLNLSRFNDALASHREALDIHRRLGDRDGEAWDLDNIGAVLDSLGRYDDAIQSHREAIAIFTALGDAYGEASATTNLGNVFSDLSRDDDALAALQSSLALERRLGDADGEADALDTIGDTQEDQEDYNAALASFRSALALHRQASDFDGEATSLDGMGLVLGDMGRLDESLVALRQSLAMFRQLGDRDGEASALADTGLTQVDGKHYDDALQSYNQALTIFRAIGNDGRTANTLQYLGYAEGDLGKYADALRYHEEALEVYQRTDSKNDEIESLSAIAATDLFLRQPAATVAAAQRGLALDPNNLRFTLLLAHGELYSGNVAGAQAIYLQHRNDRYGDTTAGQQALNDFARLRAAGVDSPDVARIEALLKAPSH